MYIASRRVGFQVAFCLLAGMALAQTPDAEQIIANQNRVAAGHLEKGILTLHLELRDGEWHPEAENGPTLFVQAFAEAGSPAQIPGPLMRMPVGTIVHVTVSNDLKTKATLYGLNERPGDAKAGLELAAGESRELTFEVGAPGTYYYWARTSTEFPDHQPLLADAQLNGAFIVDPAGPVPADRIFVIDQMQPRADVLHKLFEVLSINGKSYPYTEALEYTAGENIRWRVINPAGSGHPMHLHGAFYQVLSLGDFESDTAYGEGERQSVVTQNLLPTQTMMLEWRPEHLGRWLFHCHFQAHISSDDRVPMLLANVEARTLVPGSMAALGDHKNAGMAMNDMAGLVLAVYVNPKPGTVPESAVVPPVHRIELVIDPKPVIGSSPAFSCSVVDRKKIVSLPNDSMGPPILVTRGEATEIKVTNHLDEPATIHWHGLELDSYYDGVIGGGTANKASPAIAPGASFAARFTPNRAGTFIYHTHAPNPKQLTDGVYGPLIVLEPGERYDPEHDKLLVMGTREASFYAKRITINGAEAPVPMVLTHGVKYRLRLINIAPDLRSDFQLGSKEHPATWRAIAKDGAPLPARLAKSSGATLHIVSGETYDFEFESDAPGEIPLRVKNTVNNAQLLAKIIVQ